MNMNEQEHKMVVLDEVALKDIKNDLFFIKEMIQIFLDTLKTKKSVASFLGVTTNTLRTMLKDGRLIEGEAWLYNDKGLVEFIPNGVIEAKRKRELKKVSTVERVEPKIHPSASKFMVF